MAGDIGRLPTGAMLDPAGRSSPIGSFPLALVAAPGGDRLVALLNGHREQGIQVVSAPTGSRAPDSPAPGRIPWSQLRSDRRMALCLWRRPGRGVPVSLAEWRRGAERQSGARAQSPPGSRGTRYPGGLALSPDGRFLYVAENLADSIAVIELASGRVVQRLPAGRYPYESSAAPTAPCTCPRGAGSRCAFSVPASRRLALRCGTIRPAATPPRCCSMPDGTRLFVASASTDRVAVIDTRRDTVVAELRRHAFRAAPAKGARLTRWRSPPTADGCLSRKPTTTRSPSSSSRPRRRATVPAIWPTGCWAGSRWSGTRRRCWPGEIHCSWQTQGSRHGARTGDGPGPAARGRAGYTLDQLPGTLSTIPLADLADLAADSSAPGGARERLGPGAAPAGSIRRSST